MGKIFISYRRHGSAGYVRALLNEIRRTFGDSEAFLDLESIEAGSNFVKAIERALTDSEVVLVIMGEDWLAATDSEGRRRLDDPADFVRLEILTAFRRKIPVIPVLLDDAVMPAMSLFPKELRPLASLQALRLSHARWERDVEWLFRGIEVVTEEPLLARRYREAEELSRRGQWRQALDSFQAIADRKPDFRDVPSRLQSLRRLAEGAARLGAGPAAWRQVAIRFPLPCSLVLSLIPNVLAGSFNFLYNLRMVIQPMQQRGVTNAVTLFISTSNAINLLAFGAGILVFTHLARPVTVLLKPAPGRPAIPDDVLAGGRGRCLRLGSQAALVGTGLWFLAGPVYPALIGGMKWDDYGFFVVSLFLDGLIAAAYPFFGVTWLATRLFYAELVRPGTARTQDVDDLEKLDRTTWKFLILAGSMPMLSVAAGLVLTPIAGSTQNSFLLGVLGLSGFVGFLVAMWLFRAIQQDLAVLKDLVRNSTPA